MKHVKNDKRRRLSLEKDTLRRLADTDLTQVVGGEHTLFCSAFPERCPRMPSGDDPC